MPGKRKPIKKFVGRKFSPKRIERTHELHTEIKKRIEKIFSSAITFAEKFVDDVKHGRHGSGVRFIFLGQGMRLLFEATRAINEVSKSYPRRDIRYFVTPEASFIGLIGHKAKELQPALITAVSRDLVKQGIVSKNRKKYYIIDYSAGGRTSRFITDVIRHANPNAEVFLIDQDHSDYGRQIEYVDNMSRVIQPIKKSPLGTAFEKKPLQLRADFLYFQKLLQDYISKRKPT